MSRKRKIRERYLSQKALKNHLKELTRAKRTFVPVFVQKRQNILPYKTKPWERPNEIQYSPNIQFLWSVRRKLPRKLATFNLSKTETRQYVPEHFSLVDQCNESYRFVFELFFILYKQTYETVIIDYSRCLQLDLDAQALMDVVIKEFIDHIMLCRQSGQRTKTKSIFLTGYASPEIKKILFSIGSFKIHKKMDVHVPNIIPYHLCIGSKSNSKDELAGAEKEVHVTQLVDYIRDSLAVIKKTLTPEARSELCQVIGEILINAEEHSTTKNRYSIGFFEQQPGNKDDSKKGIFNLVIFNFGQSIYEKFKDPDCPADRIVDRMKELSSHYTEKSFFQDNFKEETLWTLYALQEGVTSIADKKRGNGSIRFIDSFLKLKGVGAEKDSISKLTLISGNTKITFDGEYAIQEVNKNGNKFNILAFNKNNNIEEKPDKKFVTFVSQYFPGTMIVAKICISENDLVQQRATHEEPDYRLELI